jgi:hypothetical protein
MTATKQMGTEASKEEKGTKWNKKEVDQLFEFLSLGTVHYLGRGLGNQ